MPISTHFHAVHDKQGKQFILNSHLELISLLMKFMRAAIYGKETFVTTFVTKLGATKTHISELGKHFSKLEPYANTYCGSYQYHPLLKFFYEEYNSHAIRDCACLHPNDRLCYGKLAFEVFDDFIVALRSKALATKLKKKVLDWEGVIKKQKRL